MKPNITIDTTKPNSARIYDYFLGGTHNYPVDRAAAKELLKRAPGADHGARLYRYFLHRAVDDLAKAEFACYLDLATGLPTEGYIHELVPATTKIIYNDIDLQTIEYTRQIIGDRPNILLMQADMREIDPILTRADQFFGGIRRVGICVVNVSYFLTDEELALVMQRLYDWCETGSQLAISGFDRYQDVPEQAQALDFYRSIGTMLYPRSPEKLLDLAQPWQVMGELRPIEEYAEKYLGLDVLPRSEMRNKVGYAGILEKAANPA